MSQEVVFIIYFRSFIYSRLFYLFPCPLFFSFLYMIVFFIISKRANDEMTQIQSGQIIPCPGVRYWFALSRQVESKRHQLFDWLHRADQLQENPFRMSVEPRGTLSELHTAVPDPPGDAAVGGTHRVAALGGGDSRVSWHYHHHSAHRRRLSVGGLVPAGRGVERSVARHYIAQSDGA